MTLKVDAARRAKAKIKLRRRNLLPSILEVVLFWNFLFSCNLFYYQSFYAAIPRICAVLRHIKFNLKLQTRSILDAVYSNRGGFCINRERRPSRKFLWRRRL